MLESFPHLAAFTPRPDIRRFIDHLLGRSQLPYAPAVEFIVDEPVLKAVTVHVFGREWVSPGSDRDSQIRYLDNLIAFWRGMGYDMLRFEAALPFPGSSRVTGNTVSGSNRERAWADESGGSIASWQDFDAYAFPRVEEFDFFPFEYLRRHLPEGMGLALAHGGGVFERVSWIFSIEKLCYLLFDQPDLVEAVVNKVGELQTAFYRQLVEFDRLAAIFPGDDMGFRSATLVSPAVLRKYFLPWHKRFAGLAHAHGVPYFLHSCGNLEKIMPDLIDTVRLDGKHSYEDAILPVERFQEKYGQRIAVLGGMDINILSAGSPQDVRERVRQLVNVCGPRGRFAIGSGNSIPDYVPVTNYLAMMDEILALKAR